MIFNLFMGIFFVSWGFNLTLAYKTYFFSLIELENSVENNIQLWK